MIADQDNRLQQLVDTGVAESVSVLSPRDKKVILGMTDTEFQSVLSIRKTILGVAGKLPKGGDVCMSFIF